VLDAPQMTAKAEAIGAAMRSENGVAEAVEQIMKRFHGRAAPTGRVANRPYDAEFPQTTTV
jgi:hypothetical protein